jgi:hypothetical protein
MAADLSKDVRLKAAEDRARMLREGEPREVIRQLSAFNGELRLALQNALERIARLEEREGYTGNE